MNEGKDGYEPTQLGLGVPPTCGRTEHDQETMLLLETPGEQKNAVMDLLKDLEFHSLDEIVEHVHRLLARPINRESIHAEVRNLRKPPSGNRKIVGLRFADGIYRWRLVLEQ